MNNKNNDKVIWDGSKSIVIKVIIIVFVFISFAFLMKSFFIDPKPLSEVSNLEDGKKRVDYIIDDWNEEYIELCEGPRNGTTKEKFFDLSSDIAIYGLGEKCEKLDYRLQMDIQEYANKEILKYPHLLHLEEGTIDCW
jgi:hypothetical protein